MRIRALLVGLLLAAGARAATLTGVVQGADGAPLADAEVKIFAPRPAMEFPETCFGQLSEHGPKGPDCRARLLAAVAEISKMASDVPLSTVRSDAAGQFRFEGSGPYDLAITARDGSSAVVLDATAAEPLRVATRGRWITGRVQGDRHRLSGVEVVAFRPRPRTIWRTQSDDDGRFVFPESLAGDVRGMVHHPGYGALLGPIGLLEPFVALDRLHRLSGHVLLDGKPVPGADVRVSDGRRAKTNANGEFAFDDVACAACRVEASAPKRTGAVEFWPSEASSSSRDILLRPCTTLTIAVTDAETRAPIRGASVSLYPGVESNGTGSSHSGTYPTPALVEKAPGEFVDPCAPLVVHSLDVSAPGYFFHEENVLLTEPEPRKVQVELRRGPTLRGRVVDAGNRSVPNATVQISSREQAIPEAVGQTDADGHFDLGPLAPGPRDVLVDDDDHLPARVSAQVPAAEELVISVRSAAALDVEIVDEAGAPVAGAGVRFVGDPDSMRYHGFEHDEANARGRLHFAPMYEGRAALYATAEGYVPSKTTAVDLRPGEASKVRLVCPRGATLSGTAVDDAGGAVGRVELLFSCGEESRETVTGAGGRFVVTGLGGSACEVATRYLAENAWYPIGRTEVVAGEPARIVVPRVARVRGRLLVDGRPASSFEVNRRNVTDADGRFELVVPPVARRLWISGAFIEVNVPLSPKPGVVNDLGDIRTVRGGAVVGTVSRDGHPLDDVLVEATRIGGPELPANLSFVARRMSGRDGDFALSSLPPGRWRLGGRGVGGIVRPAEIEVFSQQTTSIALSVEPGATVRIKVVGAKRRVLLKLKFAKGEDLVSTSPDGTFETAGLEPGPVTLSTTSGAGASTTAVVPKEGLLEVVLDASAVAGPEEE